MVEIYLTNQNINYQSAHAAEFSHTLHIYSPASSALTRQSRKEKEREKVW